MSIFRRLFFDENPHKAILTNQPTPILYALETIMYMHNTHLSENESPISRDDIIQLALRQYLRRNLSVTQEEPAVAKKEASPPPNFHDYQTGRKQTRN
jgi:hypothetical protein